MRAATPTIPRGAPPPALTRMSAADARTAEYARLFDLFHYLASRRPREADSASTPTTPTHESTPSPPSAGPEDLIPVLQKLSTALSARTNNSSRPQTPGRPRRNTLPVAEVATFPLAQRFPFTFKLMIHKLYEAEEWAEKVRQVLATSQMQFKPLAEGEGANKDADTVSGLGDAGGKKGRALSRARSHSVIGMKGGTAPAPRAPPKTEQRDDVRALKRRCVGRRKSVCGPVAGHAAQGWVYDAAVSAVGASGPAEARVRRVSLPRAADAMQMRAIAECPAREPAPVVWRWDVPQPVQSSRELSRQKRAMSLADLPGNDEVWRMKRPLLT